MCTIGVLTKRTDLTYVAYCSELYRHEADGDPATLGCPPDLVVHTFRVKYCIG